MKIEKEKQRVTICCMDGSLIRGFVHINPGERIQDFLNDERKNFVAVTNAEFQNIATVHSFKLYNELNKKREAIVLNKRAIKWMEEVRA